MAAAGVVVDSGVREGFGLLNGFASRKEEVICAKLILDGPAVPIQLILIVGFIMLSTSLDAFWFLIEKL